MKNYELIMNGLDILSNQEFYIEGCKNILYRFTEEGVLEESTNIIRTWKKAGRFDINFFMQNEIITIPKQVSYEEAYYAVIEQDIEMQSEDGVFMCLGEDGVNIFWEDCRSEILLDQQWHKVK